MAHKKPTGRKASEAARARAKDMLATLDSNTSDIPTVLELVSAIECFASTGWFPPTLKKDTTRKIAIGRRASSEAQDAAKLLVDTYIQALHSVPNGHCLNPEEYPEDQIIISAEQAAVAVVAALERFVETGFWVETVVSLERFLICEDYKSLRVKVQTSKEALLDLAKLYPRSQRDLERQVGKFKP